MDAIVLCGPTGVGKTTTAFEMSRMLAASGVTHAIIDTDELDRVFPQPGSDSELVALTARDLIAVWESYAALGHHRLILCGVMLDSASATEWMVEALGKPKITIVRLVATDSTLEARIMVREIGSGRQHHLQTALKQARQLRHEVTLNELTVVTDGRTVSGDTRRRPCPIACS
jgi:DNA polymerase III delta prime subunit